MSLRVSEEVLTLSPFFECDAVLRQFTTNNLAKARKLSENHLSHVLTNKCNTKITQYSWTLQINLSNTDAMLRSMAIQEFSPTIRFQTGAIFCVKNAKYTRKKPRAKQKI